MTLTRQVAEQRQKVLDQRAAPRRIQPHRRQIAGKFQNWLRMALQRPRRNGLCDQLLQVERYRRERGLVGHLQPAGEDPIGLFHQLLQPCHVLPRAILAWRQYKAEIVRDRLDGAQRLAQFVGDHLHRHLWEHGDQRRRGLHSG